MAAFENRDFFFKNTDFTLAGIYRWYRWEETKREGFRKTGYFLRQR
jgi:hypothetical protein